MRTLTDIENCGKEMLIPKDVAGFLHCDPYNLILAARQQPELLGFPVCVIGSRTLIPRAGFVRWARGIQEDAS